MSFTAKDKDSNCNQTDRMDANDSAIQKRVDSEPMQYRYLSEVDHIRLLRDSYKQQTQRTFEELKAQVEQQRKDRIDAAEKAIQLLEQTKTTLQGLDLQRKLAGDVLTQTVQQAKALSQQLSQQTQQTEHLRNNETNMRQLLNELKR